MWTIDKMKMALAEANHHFFDAGTMRWWNSRVLSEVYEGAGGVFFVTSERCDLDPTRQLPRVYTVRRFIPLAGNGEPTVTTVEPFGVLKKRAAQRLARLAAQHGVETAQYLEGYKTDEAEAV